MASEVVETLEFSNDIMGILVGSGNENMGIISKSVGVGIFVKGNELTIMGTPSKQYQVREILAYLENRIVSFGIIGIEDIRTALRLFTDQDIQIPATGNSQGTSHGKSEKAFSEYLIKTPKKNISLRSQKQLEYCENLDSKEIVFCTGPAGTGKTYTAVAKAVEMMQQGEVSKLIISRPAVEAGENLGFLPGDLKEKVDPFMRPIYDALFDMLPRDLVERKLLKGEIEIAPLAFMRGRTLSDAYIIMDEAQNTTNSQMKMFLTRFGERSRMVINGDLTQVDLPRGVVSGLREAILSLRKIKDIGFVEFTSKDVVRHHLVGKIIDAYSERDKLMAKRYDSKIEKRQAKEAE